MLEYSEQGKKYDYQGVGIIGYTQNKELGKKNRTPETYMIIYITEDPIKI